MRKAMVFFIGLCLAGLAAPGRDLPGGQSPYYTVPLQRAPAPSDFFDRPEEYLDWQAQNLLDLAAEALSRFPPAVTEPFERHMAMWMLDAVFHDPKAPHRPAVQEFFRSRTERAVREMETVRVEEGAVIWKLYDMGYVVRTATVTLAFDLIRGHFVEVEGFLLDDGLMSRLIDQCDVLFISHRHGDHADPWVARTFLDRGKPVAAPPDLWTGEPVFERITHLEREADTLQTLPVRSGKHALELVVYPGHQGEKTLNNVVLVYSPEGMSFCHTGDQSNEQDFAWIDRVGESHWVDVLMPNCWTRQSARTARGYNPELIIPGHENELGHSIDHREAYGLDYSRWQAPYPKLIMTWGESYHYLPRED